MEPNYQYNLPVLIKEEPEMDPEMNPDQIHQQKDLQREMFALIAERKGIGRTNAEKEIGRTNVTDVEREVILEEIVLILVHLLGILLEIQERSRQEEESQVDREAAAVVETRTEARVIEEIVRAEREIKVVVIVKEIRVLVAGQNQNLNPDLDQDPAQNRLVKVAGRTEQAILSPKMMLDQRCLWNLNNLYYLI